MKIFERTTGVGLGIFAVVLIVALIWSAQALAQSSYFTSNCSGCHTGVAATCNGCHAHGAHSGSAKSDLNVAGTTDKTSYAPGETVSVTITTAKKMTSIANVPMISP